MEKTNDLEGLGLPVPSAEEGEYGPVMKKIDMSKRMSKMKKQGKSWVKTPDTPFNEDSKKPKYVGG